MKRLASIVLSLFMALIIMTPSALAETVAPPLNEAAIGGVSARRTCVYDVTLQPLGDQAYITYSVNPSQFCAIGKNDYITVDKGTTRLFTAQASKNKSPVATGVTWQKDISSSYWILDAYGKWIQVLQTPGVGEPSN